jgi:hypothetical protein
MSKNGWCAIPTESPSSIQKPPSMILVRSTTDTAVSATRSAGVAHRAAVSGRTRAIACAAVSAASSRSA